MKKIWPWLLALLLLIIFCVSTKKDSIHVNSNIPNQSISSTPVTIEEHHIEYTIQQQNDTDYTLNGNFTNTQQQSLMVDIFTSAHKKLSIDKTATNTTLKETGIIALTNKILPLFIKTYKDGKIVYQNQKITISGTAKSYEAQHQMQALLNSSTIASQDNSNVAIETSPIEYSIDKNLSQVHAFGTFGDNTQISTLKQHLPKKAITNFNVKSHTIDKGSLPVVTNFLPFFLETYTTGKIDYNNEKLTISGNVHSESQVEEAKKLLANVNIPIVNHTQIDPKILAQAKDAAEKAKLAREAKLAEEEKLANLEAQKKAADIAAEKARLAQEAKLAAEAKKLELKNKIKDLFKVENIEFNVNKSTLTQKGLDTVNKLADILQEYPTLNININGYTDSDGSTEYNQKLSQSRVNTIKSKLIEHGIQLSRLNAKGYGEANPLLPNTTRSNKAKNRRVEIKIQGE